MRFLKPVIKTSHLVATMKNKALHFAAFVGVDWADKKHDVSISSGDGGKPVHQVILFCNQVDTFNPGPVG